ncbi:MAG: type II secretion system protein [Patescibacteria group bacterium]|jgi:general secretion pathway protein G
MFKNKKGFTLIELLVVIAIIGLLSTLAVVALSSARQKSRDSKRVSDMKQVQTAMELMFSANNSYVMAGCAAPGALLSSCNGPVLPATPITEFLPGILNLKDPNGAAACAAACDATVQAPCNYSVKVVPTATTYEFCFYLEGNTGDLLKGAHKVTPAGLQ